MAINVAIDFVSTSELSTALGTGWSREMIRRRIDNGELVEGHHFTDIRLKDASRAQLRFNLPLIKKEFYGVTDES